MDKSINPAEFRAAHDCLSRFIPEGHTKPFARKIEDIVEGIHPQRKPVAQEKIEVAYKNWRSAIREFIEFKIKDMYPGSNPDQFAEATHKLEIRMSELRVAVGLSTLPDDKAIKAIITELLPKLETAIRYNEETNHHRLARIEHGASKGGKVNFADFVKKCLSNSSNSGPTR